MANHQTLPLVAHLYNVAPWTSPDNGVQQRTYEDIQIDLNNAKKKRDALQSELDHFSAHNTAVLDYFNTFRGSSGHAADVQRQWDDLSVQLQEENKLIETLENELYHADRNNWSAMMDNDDFAAYAQQGAGIVNPSWDDVNSPERQESADSLQVRTDDVGNIVTFSMEHANSLKGPRGNTVGDYSYSFMTPDEVNIYNYLLGKYDKQTAQLYLDHLEEELHYRQGMETAEKYAQIESPFWRGVAAAPYGLAAGVEQFGTGIQQLFTEDRLPTTPMQYAAQGIRENLGTGGQVAFDVSNAVGNMLPGILIGKGLGALGAVAGLGAKGVKFLGSGVGSASMGASGAGNAYNQALREGYTKEQAKTYAALIGASEGALQFAIGGIGALGGAADDVLLAKVRTLDGVFERIAASGMIKIGSEVAEEELQLLLDPLFATMVTGEPYQAPTTEQMLETALVTAITTGILEGPSIVGVEVDYKKFGQDVLKTHTTQDVVQEALNGSRPGSAVYELAKKLSEGLTRGKTVSETDIGRLFAFSQTQLQKGKSVKAEGRTEELLQRALELPADTKAHQVAQELSEQLESALSERGFDISEDYQLTRPEQQTQINEVTDTILTDQTIGELQELVAATIRVAGDYGEKAVPYSERNIDIGERLKGYIAELPEAGKYISASAGTFSAQDLAALTTETGVEYAVLTIGDQAHLIRGYETGTPLPGELIKLLKEQQGTWDYHTHPFIGDLLPSEEDRLFLEQLTWQGDSIIVDPTQQAVRFTPEGTVERFYAGNSHNLDYYSDIFGGKEND